MPDPSWALPRTIMVFDVAEYTKAERTRTVQLAVRKGLLEEVLPKAFAGIGVDLARCKVEDRGDGANIYVPAEVSKNVLINNLPAGLVAELRRYNAVHAPEAGIQLRVVFHFGEVSIDSGGAVSPAVDLACRISEASAPKEELRRSGGLLVLIASDDFYDKVIRQDPAAEPAAWRQIPVQVKKTSTVAWLRVTEATTPPAPGSEAVPRIWGNVPARNLNFTGRLELLDKLGRWAEDGPLAYAALHGMGGIGKTELATEYIYRRQSQYDVVWWIQATQAPQIRKELMGLAGQLGLPGSAEAGIAVPAVLESLRVGRPHRRWLLVFDAAEGPEVVREFLPANGPGEVLITSRNPGWSHLARPLEVKVFARTESIQLLRRRGLQVNDHDAEELAGKLGDLPLAIEHAAAWIITTGTPFGVYLQLFEEKVAAILDTVAGDSELSVGAVWNVSFDALLESNPAALQLLQVCAFFAPDPITRDLFTGLRGTLLPELDTILKGPLELGRAIGDINRYGLAKVDHGDGTLQMHSVVQKVLRNRMTMQTWENTRHVAHLLLAGADPNNPSQSTTWQRYQDLLPHVHASELVQCDDGWARQLVINMTQFLYYWGDRKEALKLARQARDRWSQRSGDTDLFALRAATYMGLCLSALGRFPEAAELNRRTLDQLNEVSGENSKETIIVELLVAADTKSRGEFLAAKQVQERIYEKARGLFDDDDLLTLQTAHDLASTLRLCGEYRRALTLDEHTYLRRAQVLGNDSMDTLNSLQAMIIDQRELGQYQWARTEQEKIVERLRGTVGDDRADVFQRMADLSVARRRAGDHIRALELSERALTLYTRHYEPDHPNALACKIGHAINLRHKGDLQAARNLGDEAFRQYKTALGKYHPYTAIAAVNLAVTLRLLGHVTDAQQHDERALDQLRAALGADHPYAIACAVNLASDLSDAGSLPAALSCGSDAMDRAKRTLGEDHPITRAASFNHTMDQSGDSAASRINCDIDPLPM